RGAADHAEGRAQGQAAGAGARLPLRRLAHQIEIGGNTMQGSTAGAIKVGVIADQTGPLSFMGVADANVAKMVIDDINAGGGLLGQQIELHLEDSETTDSAAEACATKLVKQAQVDVIFGGIFSSTRQAI